MFIPDFSLSIRWYLLSFVHSFGRLVSFGLAGGKVLHDAQHLLADRQQNLLAQKLSTQVLLHGGIKRFEKVKDLVPVFANGQQFTHSEEGAHGVGSKLPGLLVGCVGLVIISRLECDLPQIPVINRRAFLKKAAITGIHQSGGQGQGDKSDPGGQPLTGLSEKLQRAGGCEYD